MDSNLSHFPAIMLPSLYGSTIGFPGFPYLAALTTRAEFRQMATSFSTEMTREWIKLSGSETASDDTKAKITDLTKELDEMDLRSVIRTAIEHDCYYGRAQVFINIRGHKADIPLTVSKKTIKKGDTFTVRAIEAMWTTPVTYNASDPTQDDFYKPPAWFLLGRKVDSTRLQTIVTRPVSDMLKPAFNFAGMSLSQLAEPCVENWLRTRQSVSDLINNFSILVLKTAMEAVLQDGDDGTDLFERAKLFIEARDNKGLMLIDKDKEELEQISVPLAGLDKLQAQAQEHLCAVSRQPAIILTGISPTGLNASSEGEIRVFYDWIAAQQELWRKLIGMIINILQLTMYGSIDPDITFNFVPLYQMSAKELADVRTANATTAGTLIDRGVISAEEERERLARDPESGYDGLNLDPSALPEVPGQAEGEDNDEDDKK
jgi:phage-related protein (TIGR01555 family)